MPPDVDVIEIGSDSESQVVAERTVERAQFGQGLAQASRERHAELQKAAVNIDRSKRSDNKSLSYRPKQTGKSRGSRRRYRNGTITWTVYFIKWATLWWT